MTMIVDQTPAQPNAQNVYCYSLVRSQKGTAAARYPYHCVALYVAKPRADGTLTWRRDHDLTRGFRSPAKAIRESRIDDRRVLRVRQNDPVTFGLG